MSCCDCTTVTLSLTDVCTHVYGLPGMDLCLINHTSTAGRMILPGIFTNSTSGKVQGCKHFTREAGSGDAAIPPHDSDPAPELGITSTAKYLS